MDNTYTILRINTDPEELADNPDECINFYKPDDVQIIYPYLGISSPSVIIGIGFAFCYHNAKSVKAGDNNQAKVAQNETSQQATVENPENPGKPENSAKSCIWSPFRDSFHKS